MQCICIVSAVVPGYLITCRLMSVLCDYFSILICMMWYLSKLLQDACPLFEGLKKIFQPSDTI